MKSFGVKAEAPHLNPTSPNKGKPPEKEESGKKLFFIIM